MSTVSDKKAEKRNKIIESAYHLFSSKSVSATAIDEVAKMAGVAKGTFYLYFKDKYDLLEQIITMKSADLFKDAIKQIGDNNDYDCVKKTIAVCDYIIDYLISHVEFTALLDKNFSYCFKIFLSGSNPDYDEILYKFISAFVDYGFTEQEAKIKIYFITELIGSVCCSSILNKGPFTMDDVRDELNNSIRNLVEVK